MKQFLKNIFYIKCIAFEYLFPTNKGHVLMYHSFNLLEVFFNVSFGDFRKQIEFLIAHRYHIIPLEEFLDRKHRGLSLRKCIAITFDDGYIGLGEVLEYLNEKNIPTTLFWPSGVPENILRLSNGVEYKILSYDQVAGLLAKYPGLSIGSHGVTHRELTKISHDDVKYELTRSLQDISRFVRHIPVIAYPRGKYNQKVIEIAENLEYKAGLTTREGGIDVDITRFEIPRITADSTVGMLAFAGKLTRFYDWYKKILR